MDLTKIKLTSSTKALGVFVLTLAILSGCNTDQEDVSTLDQQLEEALMKASNGQGKVFYQFPQSTDYSNIPQDANNPITEAKVALGKMLFFETAIGITPKNSEGMQTYSCATCHHVAAGFQAGTFQGIGEGGVGFGIRGEGRTFNANYNLADIDVQDVRSPSALNIAYQTNVLWNGQFGAKGVNLGTEAQWTPGTPKFDNHLGFDGVETQAIAAMNVHRLQVEGSVCDTSLLYTSLFAQAFPNVPENERVSRVNAGLAIAAYERTLLATEAPFQRWLKGEQTAMSYQEKMGALVFFGKGNCYTCHNGPALNSMEFYALGMKDLYEKPGTINANINSVGNKGRGGFTQNPADMYKFKVPQLYNLKDSPFYGHGASFITLEEVLNYKNAGIPENPNVPASQLALEFVPLNLTISEVAYLKTFLEKSLYDSSLSRYVPTNLPSGFCFPNSDVQSKLDLDCN